MCGFETDLTQTVKMNELFSPAGLVSQVLLTDAGPLRKCSLFSTGKRLIKIARVLRRIPVGV